MKTSTPADTRAVTEQPDKREEPTLLPPRLVIEGGEVGPPAFVLERSPEEITEFFRTAVERLDQRDAEASQDA